MKLDIFDMTMALFLSAIAFFIICLGILLLTGTGDRRHAYGEACERDGGSVYAPSDIWFCLDDEGHMLRVYVP